MDQQELNEKLQQIEEHSRDALAAFPELTKERLRMILALAKYIRSGLEEQAQTDAARREQKLTAIAFNDRDALDSAQT